MASSYNLRRPAPEAVVREAEWAVVRPRADYDELIGRDRLPAWLETPAKGAARGAA